MDLHLVQKRLRHAPRSPCRAVRGSPEGIELLTGRRSPRLAGKVQDLAPFSLSGTERAKSSSELRAHAPAPWSRASDDISPSTGISF